MSCARDPSAEAGEGVEDLSGRCAAILSNGKRCPNTALPGSRFCGVQAHQELAEREARGEDLTGSVVTIGAPDDEEPGEAEAEGEETEVGEAEVVAEAAVEEESPSAS